MAKVLNEPMSKLDWRRL